MDNIISSDLVKIQAVQQWPAPWTVKELRGFLKLIGYYKRFVQHYRVIAKTLTELLKKDQFEWLDQAQLDFNRLKQAMITTLVLALLDFNKVFVVESNASWFGLGVVLIQDKH